MVNIKTPVIIINSKAYTESTLNNEIKLVRICEEVRKEYNVNIIYAPQMVNLAYIAKNFNIPCMSQHVDAIEPGAKTGYISLEAIKEAGAIGSIINHSEHVITFREAEFIINRAKKLDLIICACADNVRIAKSLATLEPEMIAVEPPELIGTGISVSKAKPEIVSKSVEEIKKINDNVLVLCGAGISTGEDVKKAIDLGAEGVLLSSSFVKAKNPREKILDLISKI